MMILQLDNEQLSDLIKSSVRSVLCEAGTPSQHPQTEQPLTLAEAAKFLSISNQTLYKRTGSREIPCIKVQGQKRLYFLKADLIEYLKTGRKKTGREIAAEADRYLANKKGR